MTLPTAGTQKIRDGRGGIRRWWKQCFQFLYSRFENQYLRLKHRYLLAKLDRLDRRATFLIAEIRSRCGWHVQYPSGSGEVLTQCRAHDVSVPFRATPYYSVDKPTNIHDEQQLITYALDERHHQQNHEKQQHGLSISAPHRAKTRTNALPQHVQSTKLNELHSAGTVQRLTRS